jgi:hypothetical protein
MTIQRMTPQEREALCQTLAEAIRKTSSAGQLVGKEALLASLSERGLLAPEEPETPDMEALLAEMLATNEDLTALTSISGEILYHAPALLSTTYASILTRKTSPIILMAEEIRRNSAEYPRPIPLDLFEQPPFDLTPEQIEASLKTMAASPEFDDVSFTTTSTGAVYLFSTLHLERPYAAFLAERADVGLLLNP